MPSLEIPQHEFAFHEERGGLRGAAPGAVDDPSCGSSLIAY